MKHLITIQRFCLFLFALVLAAPAVATDYRHYGYQVFRSRNSGKHQKITSLQQGHVEIRFSYCYTTGGTGNSAIYELGRGVRIDIDAGEGYAICWVILRDTEGGEDYDHPDGIKRIQSVSPNSYKYYFEKNAISNSKIDGANYQGLNDDNNNIVIYNYDAPAQNMIIWAHEENKWDELKVRDIIVGYVEAPKVSFEKNKYDLYFTPSISERKFKPVLNSNGHTGNKEYKVNNNDIATVDAGGTLTFKRPGTAVLTATFSANKIYGIRACRTTVNMMRDRVTFTADGLPDILSGPFDLRGQLHKTTASGREFQWNNPQFSVTSSNSAVLRYADGKLQLGGRSGEATITFKQEQNDYYEATTFSHTFIVARKDQNGTILIKDADEWKQFCKFVNEKGMTKLNAKLENDVDLGSMSAMLGTKEHRYGGMFDGNNHTLTVHIVGTGQGTAPFSYTNGATIKNLTIAGTVTAPANTDNYHTAGLVGFAESTTLRRCVVKADIHLGRMGDQYSGGLIGHILSGNTTIEDCAFIGSIRGDKGYISNIAGLVAWGDAGTLTIRNSYVNATYTKVRGLNPILRRHKSTSNHLNNVHYSVKSGGINPDREMYGDVGYWFSDYELKNGGITYQLQAGRSQMVWGQTLGKDNDPLLTADATKRVHKVEFRYNGHAMIWRFANTGKGIHGSLPTARELLGEAYDASQTYSLTFDGGFSETTAITGDRTVNVTVAITTGIDGVTNDAADTANGPVYDLQGRRVADRLDDAARHQLPAGVYIVGGRKVVVK